MKQNPITQMMETIVWAVLISMLMAGTASAWQMLPGLSVKHPLTQPQVGELLFAELRCAACHGGIEPGVPQEKTAPSLLDVGARISPAYLQRFLASPSSVQPGTMMPDVLNSQSDSDRQNIANALTHFLVAQSKRVFQPAASDAVNQAEGKALYHAVGCVACHGPQETLSDEFLFKKLEIVIEDEDEVKKEAIAIVRPVGVKLGHVPLKYSSESLSEFLFQPLRVRSSGRMPDLKLTQLESQAIAGYLRGEQSGPREVLVPLEPLVTLGKKYFQEFNCGACHSIEGIPAVPVLASLNQADSTRGCLSKKNGKHPRFHLADPQVQALAASLKEERHVDSDAVHVAKILTTFNCIACHIRDDYGGVPEDYNPFYLTSEKNQGEDGRIPPPLTLVGAKLQPAWLKKVLFDGESVRPYMTTRMPQYGMANLHHLPDVFARLDVLAGREMHIPNPKGDLESERERNLALRKAGQELLGDKGLNCINCHNFNGKPSPVNQGIDLMTSYQRLQPAWFNSFLRNPGAFRPRILMPTAWSNGVASHKTILDGNPEMQIEAIWYYLSLGTSAADPSGIRGVNTKLSVGNEARTYRGRSRVAGFRGIAVGLPQKLSYAFNAETGTLSALWQGDFISVNRHGQGSGDFNPASDPVTLAQDVSFTQLEDQHTPWPLMPEMTKEGRVNPDALYPKNHGYQFRGYILDESAIPTFIYRSGTIEIEDRSRATDSDKQQRLMRTLQLNSPTEQTVWFRALTGEINAESARSFRAGQLRITIPDVGTRLRSLPDNPASSELLLEIKIPQGKSSLEIIYEPLEK